MRGKRAAEQQESQSKRAGKTGYWYLIEYSVDGLLTRGYVAQNRLVDVQVGVPETTEKGVLKIGGGKPLYAGRGIQGAAEHDSGGQHPAHL